MTNVVDDIEREHLGCALSLDAAIDESVARPVAEWGPEHAREAHAVALELAAEAVREDRDEDAHVLRLPLHPSWLQGEDTE